MGELRIVERDGLAHVLHGIEKVELLSGQCSFIATSPSPPPETEAQQVARYAKEIHDWTWELTKNIIGQLRDKHNGDASGREDEQVTLYLSQRQIPLSEASIVSEYLQKHDC